MEINREGDFARLSEKLEHNHERNFQVIGGEAQEGYKSSLVQAKDQINSINQEG
jgi:hypothetical protein